MSFTLIMEVSVSSETASHPARQYRHIQHLQSLKSQTPRITQFIDMQVECCMCTSVLHGALRDLRCNIGDVPACGSKLALELQTFVNWAVVLLQ